MKGDKAKGESTLQGLKQVDYSVKQLLGHGLERWLPGRKLSPWFPRPQPLTPDTWYHLDQNMDQGSTGSAGAAY